MKKIACLFILFSILSCEIHYDGEQRYILETKVTDKNGNSLKDINIEVYADNDNISYATTDANGSALQIFPPRSYENTFSMTINPDREDYQSLIINNIKQSDFANYFLNIGTFALFKSEDITTFNIDLNPIDPTATSLVSLEINAITPINYIDYQGEEDGGEGIYYPQTHFRVIKNQTFIVFYTIRDHTVDPPALIEHTFNVAMGNEPLTYNLEY